MRPLRLQMKGFGAFRDETLVDFTDIELLALVGNTGSGKSTVIDAMTFALYGTVARYDDARAVAPAINTLSNEASVQLVFELGGLEYTAVRVARRTASGGATTREARLECGGEVLADAAKPMTASVEALLGLDFARFTKVVVLPQGKFASFLHDRPKDRQDLLRQLLDLGIYERLGRQARDTAKDADIQLGALEGQLETQGVTDAQLQELESQAGALAKARVALDEMLGRWASAEQAAGASLLESEGLGVLAIAASQVTVPEEVALLATDLAAAQDSHDKVREHLTAAVAGLEDADQQVAAGPDAAASRRTLDQHEELIAVTERAKLLGEQLDTAEQHLAQMIEAAVAARSRIAAVEAEAVQARTAQDLASQALRDGPDATYIAQVRDRRSELEVNRAKLATLADDADALQQRLSGSGQAADETGKELEAATQLLRRVESAKTAEALVAALHAGDDCPVCGQVVHDVPSHDIDAEVEQAHAAVASAAERDAAAREDLAAARRDVDRAEAQQQAATTRQQELEQGLADQPSDADLDDLERSLVTLATELEESQQARSLADQAFAHIRDDQDVRGALDAEAQAGSQRISAEASLAAARAQQAELEQSLIGQPTPDQLETMIVQAGQLAAARATAEQARSAGQKELDDAAATLSKLQAQERASRLTYGKVRDTLIGIGAPEPDGASLAGDWNALSTWAAERSAALLIEHRRAATHAEEQRALLDAASAEAMALSAEHLTSPADQPTALAQQMLEAETRARTQHEDAVQALERAAQTRQRVDNLKETRSVHTMLGGLLKADGFERWIMDEVVAGLVQRASVRLFQLSNEQYSLEAEQMDFKVRDHLNGGELRDAKTLSGGETFLASLALALALADSLADMAPEGTPALESLFLDEGFGTLDPETLDVVAGAIEELGASGRMVGIVTHIRELAERMPVRLEVSKGPTTSIVEKVEA